VSAAPPLGDGLVTSRLAVLEQRVEQARRRESRSRTTKSCSTVLPRSVRVATDATEADIAVQHIATARGLGMDVSGFLMMSHMAPPADLAKQAKLMETAGAHCVYVTDSGGRITMTDVRDRVGASATRPRHATPPRYRPRLTLTRRTHLLRLSAYRVPSCVGLLTCRKTNNPLQARHFGFSTPPVARPSVKHGG